MFLEYVLAGLGVGVVFGMFGAGGSAFATPVLALLGVPGLLAVASPLPAMVPAAFMGARRFLASGNLDRRVARLAILGGVPGTLLGALGSRVVGGDRLLVLSGLLLLGIGAATPVAGPLRRSARAADRLQEHLGRRGFRLRCRAAHRPAGQRRRVPPRPAVRTRPRAHRGQGRGHVDGRRRSPDDPHARVPLGARPHRLDGGRGVRHRTDPCVGPRRPALRERLVDPVRLAFGTMLIGFSIWFLVRQLT